ncbi:sigma-54 dependent transcriptional regulator [Sphingobium sufflavum]|uniref:sigma-54-dependent transcriptional regulator n=1 Tax=Sphingobium sufflavum TaxID=1129547 RepID=UPI001F34D918|nr:sigma-54 dependent transcriptional regulator [Sphingobium sufflavum]MCE7796487.1 sigma-54 dependent transcriptional regulator [Sphingobium sufflavum]
MSEGVRRVALVEDDDDLRASTAQLLTLAGFTVDSFPAAEPALAAIDEDYPGVVVTDVRMPHISGIELFRTLHVRDAELPVVLVTGHGDVAMAVDALKAGAWDFMAKPFDPEMLVAAVMRASMARALALDNRRLRMLADSEEGAGLVGRSPAIRRLREMIPMLADANIDLFIEGESGTGKELLARLIHRAGKRSRHRFLPVACGAVPDAVIETGLFASVGEGSIAGASRGTLFLDDMDQASRALQSRLVPLIEQRALQPSGGRAAIPLDLRVIAAAGDAGEEGPGSILPALFYRLATLRLRMPPLRERREDVPLLFVHLAGISAARLRREVSPITAEVRDRLATHDWPGNVRELANFADRFVLGLDDPLAGRTEAEDAAASLSDRVDAFERDAIVGAVIAARGDIGRAIESLGVPRKTFYYKVNKHGIDLRLLRGR